MKKIFSDFITFYLVQLGGTLFYAFLNGISVKNPFFIMSEVFITILFIVLVYYIKNKKLPRYAVDRFRNKCFFIFVFVCFLPLICNMYLHYRVLEINSVNDFRKIEWNPRGKYIINKDIDFKGFTNNNNPFVINEFKGTLDGNSKTIYNLEIPLFRAITKDLENEGVIKDLYVQNVNIKIEEGSIPVAAIAHYNSGLIKNVHVRGKIEGVHYVGGLVGKNFSKIEYSSFNGSIKGDYFVGGISGFNNSSIKTSYTQGKIKGVRHVGGIVGILDSKSQIKDCYSVQDISGKKYVGGIAGTGSSSINSSFVLGNITGENSVSVLSNDDTREVKSFILGKINCDSYIVEPNIFYGVAPISENEVPDEQLINSSIATKDWFINEIGLDENIWDFTPLKNNEAPIIIGIQSQPQTKID